MGKPDTGVLLHDEIVGKVRQLIVDGELAPGSRIPERSLCEKFGISRTPLREALKILSTEGQIVLLPNRGARVAKLTVKDVEELFEVSGALESLAGELACARISESALEEIRVLHSEMAQYHKSRDLRNYFLLNRKIHEAIVKASDNAVLLGTYEAVSIRIRRARFVANMPQEHWDIAMSEHEGILNALSRRDGLVLAAILKRHLKNKSRQVAEAGLVEDSAQESVGDLSTSP